MRPSTLVRSLVLVLALLVRGAAAQIVSCSTDADCDDHDACTGVEHCLPVGDSALGACVAGTPVVCPAPAACHAPGTCDSSTGLCDDPVADDGTACSDGDACTVGDACRGGACVPGASKQCGGADACHDDATCDPLTGECGAPPPKPNDTPCDDGDGCTVGDACRGGVCVAGQPRVCDDGVACTDDRCVAGACVFTPRAARCAPPADTPGCVRAECRPDDPAADADGCIVAPAGEGDACTDDGIACTDEVCRGGRCVHDRIDARCTAADPCATAVCFPDFPGADAAGCAPGPPGPDGGVCTEDHDPCTDDACTRGVCQHPNVADRDTCVPIDGAYQQALALQQSLGALRTAIRAQTTGAADGSDAVRRRLDDHAGAIDAALGTIVAVLSGRAPTSVASGPVALRRARTALPLVRRLPLQAQAMVRTVLAAGRSGALGAGTARTLRDQARGLLAQTKTLRRTLRNLRRVVQTFTH